MHEGEPILGPQPAQKQGAPLVLVALGSLAVGVVFTLFGAGTLAMGRDR